MFVSEAVWQRILEKLKKTLVGLEAYRGRVRGSGNFGSGSGNFGRADPTVGNTADSRFARGVCSDGFRQLLTICFRGETINPD